MSDKKTSEGFAKVISGNQNQSFAKWSIPSVDEFEQAQAEDEEPLLPMLTAEQLDEIQQQAHQEAYAEGNEKGFQEGFEKGYEEGRTLGEKQAFESAKEHIQEQAELLDKMLFTLRQPYRAMTEQVEHEISELAFLFAKQMLRHELQQQPDIILKQIKQALEKLPSRNKELRIHMHPEDLSMVREYTQKLESFDFDNLHLFSDEAIEQGGFIVDAGDSYIDESLHTRILAMEAFLEQQLAMKDPETDDSIDAEEKQQSDEKILDEADFVDVEEAETMDELNQPETSIE